MSEWYLSAISGAIGGAAGVIVTLKVALARLETNYQALSKQVDENKLKLEEQVGEDHCREMRRDCQSRIDKGFDKSERQQDKIFQELRTIAIWMAKHNGD